MDGNKDQPILRDGTCCRIGLNMADDSKREALQKILSRERADGFQDTTVIGGLDRFLQRWARELEPAVGERGSYSVLTPPQRERWADEVMARLGDAERGTAASGTPQPRLRAPRRSQPPLSLGDDVSRLKGVSRQNVAKLKRLGVRSVGDLVYLFPHRHNDFGNVKSVSELEPGADQTVVVTVWEASTAATGPRRKSTQAVLGDDSGNVRAVWFNNPYMARTLRTGAQVVISGRVNAFRGQLVFESPEYELLSGQDELVHTGRLVPVYPATQGLPQRTLRRLVKQALDRCISQVTEFLPEGLRHRTGLIGVQNAMAQAHYPDSHADWGTARRRLAFDELFLMQLAVLRRKRLWREAGAGIALEAGRPGLETFLGSLPFTLTAAQLRALDEIGQDLGSDRPMSRLLQGDVGSGKTVVALAALLTAVGQGYQGALMAPTEILAEQHFLTFGQLLSGVAEPAARDGVVTARIGPDAGAATVGLLLGSMSKRDKERTTEALAQGEIDIAVGTHALIQSSVEIPGLALVVVDEQHRFGVIQRASLRGKGRTPHLLAMSATPIPRSLALTVYGDLDLSVIDELPPGRQSIRTRLIEPGRREAAYEFVRGQVAEGRQAFIVCPLIEESEAVQSRAAVEEYQRLATDVYPELRLGLLHGRMRLREKQQTMDMFKRGDLDILVSTPVVEVGIDVPNATVMLIDGADRFGLAQLHQFRGRVGRGTSQSYCLLLADSPGGDARKRLKIVERVKDGFMLAEEDLRLRGPGDYLGTRQSGLPDLRMARITDQDILHLARVQAASLLESDPSLSSDENAALAERLERYTASFPDEPS